MAKKGSVKAPIGQLRRLETAEENTVIVYVVRSPDPLNAGRTVEGISSTPLGYLVQFSDSGSRIIDKNRATVSTRARP